MKSECKNCYYYYTPSYEPICNSCYNYSNYKKQTKENKINKCFATVNECKNCNKNCDKFGLMHLLKKVLRR